MLTKPKGRPPKNPTKLAAYLAQKAAWEQSVIAAPIFHDDNPTETNEDIVVRVSNMFDIFHKYAKGAVEGNVRSLIVSGAGGVGKSHMIDSVLEYAKENQGVKYEIVKGVLSPINLYMLLWRNQTNKHIIVLDDADSIFADEGALSLLKNALDSTPVRKICWFAESKALKENDIPKEILYQGSMIFITNRDFDAEIKHGGRYTPHMQALMTRALYLDLKLHTAKDLAAWIRHIVSKNHILIQEGLSYAQENEVLDFISDNKDKLRHLSIRTAIKLAAMVKTDGESWRESAKLFEMRGE
jgi:hypothetical protein